MSPGSAPSIPSAADPSTSFAGVRGILLDVDGTLYDQRRLRAAMLLRLLRFAATSPTRGAATVRALREYRRAQEFLRTQPGPAAEPCDLSAAQLRRAVERSGLPERFVFECVSRWMDAEPLPLLRRFVRPGLEGFIRLAAERRMPVGIVSDYAAAAKLQALGIADGVQCVVSAQDPDVGHFKPHPQGLLVGARRLGLAPADVLYVGDRPEVDGAAAAAAGMRCIIVGRAPRRGDGAAHVADFSALQRLVPGP